MGWFSEKHYDAVYRIAKDALARLKPELIARRACVKWLPDEQPAHFELEFLGGKFHITHPQGEVTAAEGDTATETKILLLHYLAAADGRLIDNHWISFREIPGVESYFPVFEGRVTNRLLRRFGTDPERFRSILQSLGGRELCLGGALSMQIFALPMIPIGFVLHAGAEEFGPTLATLLDSSVVGYLPLEDIVILCEHAVAEINRRNKIIDNELKTG